MLDDHTKEGLTICYEQHLEETVRVRMMWVESDGERLIGRDRRLRVTRMAKIVRERSLSWPP
jgi:hypothetical protein